MLRPRARRVSWVPINWAALEERPPVEPTIGGLLYPARRHVFSGPPESAKTWAAFALAIEEIRAGGIVAHVDFEMFAWETRERLRLMGVSDDELERVLHVEPETAATPDVIAELVEYHRPTVAIIDAAAGAYALQGLDDNKRLDVELFAATMIEPFRVRNVTTILLDHVTKNQDNRGAFSIGSERKIGSADVHLGFDPIVPFGRGRHGLIKVTTHKDRFGYLPRPRAAELEIRSDPETHAVTWQFNAPADQDTDGFRPTKLMERVARFLEHHVEPASRRQIEDGVTGKRDYIRQAIDALVADGYATEHEGSRGSRLYQLTKPYSPPVAPTSPGRSDVTSPLAPLYKGGEDEDDVAVQATIDLAPICECGSTEFFAHNGRCKRCSSPMAVVSG
jgi:hypothetical protein